MGGEPPSWNPGQVPVETSIGHGCQSILWCLPERMYCPSVRDLLLRSRFLELRILIMSISFPFIQLN